MKKWKTITTGGKPTYKGYDLSSRAKELIKKIEFPSKKEKVDLVKISVAALFGDDNVHSTQEIIARAKKIGLKLCSASDAIYLREQYKNQPADNWLYVGMEPIRSLDGFIWVSRLFNDYGSLCLGAGSADPENLWLSDVSFLFRLHRTKKDDTLELEEHYSGENSRLFWNKINSIKGKKGRELYLKGCKLQNLEGEILKDINKGRSL